MPSLAPDRFLSISPKSGGSGIASRAAAHIAHVVMSSSGKGKGKAKDADSSAQRILGTSGDDWQLGKKLTTPNKGVARR